MRSAVVILLMAALVATCMAAEPAAAGSSTRLLLQQGRALKELPGGKGDLPSSGEPSNTLTPRRTDGDDLLRARGFRANNINGAQNVPPRQTATTARFEATLQPDNSAIEWQLFVNKPKQFIQAHLHWGAPGVNGDAVVTLVDIQAQNPNGITGDFKLFRGTFTATALMGELQGKTLADLFAAIKNNNIYVNGHDAIVDGLIRQQVALNSP